LLLVLAAAATCIYFKNRSYISALQSLASEGITTANYNELPEIIKKLPITKKVFSTENYPALYGDDKVAKISRINGSASVALSFKSHSPDPEKRSSVVYFNLNSETNMAGMFLFTSVEVRGGIVGQGHQGSRVFLELHDANGKAMYGPHIRIPQEGKKIHIVMRPTVSEPMPTGSFQNNFDLTRVVKIGLRFALGNSVNSFPANGRLYIEDILAITNTELIASLLPKPDNRRVTQDTINLTYQYRKLKWKTEKKNFFVGINYPWHYYGMDVGQNPYGQPENAGWSANQEKLIADFEMFKESGIDIVRIYIFFDLRTGLTYQDGKLLAFDKYVWRDIESIFVAAHKTDMKIIPVLFDFGVADGQGKDNGSGEHPELLFFQDKHNFLAYLMRSTLQAMNAWNEKYGEPVFAVELMNEPENMAMLIIPGYFEALKNWLKDLINIIHNETSFKVTLGSYSIVDMQKWWKDLDIDAWQFHFYRYMAAEHEQNPIDLRREKVDLSGPVFAGEYEPEDIVKNLKALKENGYGGIIFWAWNTNDGFKLESSERFKEISDWILNEKSPKNKTGKEAK